jgi:hypothetical protein
MDRLFNLDDAVHENTGCHNLLRINTTSRYQFSRLRNG